MGFGQRKFLQCVVVSAALAISLGACAGAALAGTVGWSLRAVAEPSVFSANDALMCQAEQKCDSYQLVVMNVGDEASSGPITVRNKLPPGITTHATPVSGEGPEGGIWSCTEGAGNSTVTCTFAEPVAAGRYAPSLKMEVSAPSAGMSGSLRNETSVSGGGSAAAVSTSETTQVASQAPPFGVSEFDMEPGAAGGAPSAGAGAHPWEFTTTVGVPSSFSPASSQIYDVYAPVENVKSVAAELPAGFVGDPQSTPRCTRIELSEQEPGEPSERRCPAGSRVGRLAIRGGDLGQFEFSGNGCCSAIYNMVPEEGYPAEFAFTFDGQTIYLYASVVHVGSGYRLRIAVVGLPELLETSYAALTFYGDPGKLNGDPSEPAFLTNPADCPAGPLSSHVEVVAWEDPEHPALGEAVTYPGLSGCDLLRFDPSLSFAPNAASEGGSTQADAPSAYTVDLKLPQTSGFNELATPPLRAATVTLPAGVSVSPSAAQGLVGCQSEGPEGINLGSSQVGAGGQDLGDPEATELGAGHAGGNASAYDDGFYHLAHGHCPAASTIATVEAFTPILASGPGGSAPLKGHVYLAAPRCGGAGQPVCTEASATNGELFGLYMELEGDGIVVKFPGTVAADPVTGRLTATFKDLIQQPFSDLRLHFHGGPRATLANPQACGAATTTSVLEPWSAPGTPTATVSSSFNVDWDGQGGACPGLPFAPAFTAGTVTPSAGAFSAFTATFSRQDREQDPSGVSLRMPPGLLGVLKSVPLCGEPQAAQGACGAQSLIGHATATAGAGSQPFPVSGQVFLTGPYHGAPFGLSIVVPADAGPFHLGNIVVRAGINVDPHTAQVLVTSDPLPQIVDGVPLRVKMVNVTIDRQGFIFNPTNCAQQQVTGTITAAQGASANVASSFAVTGCTGLPFKPAFTVSTQASTSKKNGASLDVKTSYPAGSANIRSVAVTLPVQLPARLTTIQQACPEATFNQNPAGCPAGSVIGVGTATTPILAGALTGPAFLVSHGGAAFPDLVLILQGEGVTVQLTGSINIKKNITSSTFASIPDAPISGFELKLPEGPHSGLAAVLPAKAKGSLCGSSLTMPTTITAQNGAVVKQSTKIKVTGCPAARKKPKKARHARAAQGGRRSTPGPPRRSRG